MERISGHDIDSALVEKLSPLPIKVRYYVDGYGAKKTSEVLYDLGDNRLVAHLKQQSHLSPDEASQLYDRYYSPPSPTIFAEILSYSLAVIEMCVVSAVEERMKDAGKHLYPNALLVNQTNPLNVDVNGVKGNILEALHPLTEEEFSADSYLDVKSDGIIYSPKKVDRSEQRGKMQSELAKLSPSDPHAIWLKASIKSLEDGVMHYKKRDGRIGDPINFGFSEDFFDEVSARIGYYSRLGKYKIHRAKQQFDIREKGVDCDLIMQVMDDLHSGEVDIFVIMTNDMDFFPLIERIRHDGRQAFLCGLDESVSHAIKDAVGNQSFFNMRDEKLLQNLPTVFMAMEDPSLRQLALQWAWLALRREQISQP